MLKIQQRKTNIDIQKVTDRIQQLPPEKVHQLGCQNYIPKR